MHSELEILEMIRLGQVQPLTAESLPRVAARQQEINQRFAAALQSPYVGGNRLPHAITASATKKAKPDRARAVALLVGAGKGRRSTLRRKQLEARKNRRE